MTLPYLQDYLPVKCGRSVADAYEDLLLFPAFAASHSASQACPQSLLQKTVFRQRLEEANRVATSSGTDDPPSPFRPGSEFGSMNKPPTSDQTICLRDLESTERSGPSPQILNIHDREEAGGTRRKLRIVMPKK
ncbi:hypothetical protein CKAH01_15075 [Colletotrichum kahawae]|uniref:Uncharacterized protein n=1 Tax=Colletotrichum kahawae TaxID=34407 RepID=A0AAE0DBK5_COLKA|nr:hypothetical protein CKAH01_15075 [Colletotrichum kahawae]